MSIDKEMTDPLDALLATADQCVYPPIVATLAAAIRGLRKEVVRLDGALEAKDELYVKSLLAGDSLRRENAALQARLVEAQVDLGDLMLRKDTLHMAHAALKAEHDSLRAELGRLVCTK